MTEKDHRKEMPPEAAVLQEGYIKKRADITSKQTVRIRRVIIGILPYVKTTNSNRDAKIGEEVRIQAKKVDTQLHKKPKKKGGKGSVTSLKNSKP